MKELCLLAVVLASIAGCASTPGVEAGNGAARERISDTYVPTGTIIPRKRSERGGTAAPVAEADKQALENERLMSTRQ
jgi:hypothetical protein